MFKNVTRVSTLGMSREEWLVRRKRSLGGSDAAAVVGLSQWSSPYSVWADKTGRIPPKPDNEAMRQGRDLEHYVATRWAEKTGKKVRHINAMLYQPRYPFAHADVDRWVVGENAGLECKTTGMLNLKHFRNGAYPAHYYAQCVHYMAVTGADRWYLGVLVLGQGFYPFVIERDELEIASLMKQEEDFWGFVASDEPPCVDGMRSTTDAIKHIYAASEGGSVELFGREALFEAYRVLQEEQRETAREIAQIKQTLMLDLGGCEEGFCGNFTVSWKPQVRSSLSREKLRESYPNLDFSKAMTARKFRRFQVKEDENATG